MASGAPAEGVWLVTRGGDAGTSHNGLNLKTTVDFYVGFANKLKTETVHKQILEYFTENVGFCELSGKYGDFDYAYENIRVRPTATPENVGATENGVIVKVASYNIIYDLITNERS